MSAYQVVARNFSTSSENRMHSDEIASRYGFRGALCPALRFTVTWSNLSSINSAHHGLATAALRSN